CSLVAVGQAASQSITSRRSCTVRGAWGSVEQRPGRRSFCLFPGFEGVARDGRQSRDFFSRRWLFKAEDRTGIRLRLLALEQRLFFLLGGRRSPVGQLEISRRTVKCRRSSLRRAAGRVME